MRQIYDHMAQELQRHPGLLQSYRNDFEVLDFRELTDWGAHGARYVWIARSSGSDLALLDVHPDVTAHCRAILKLRNGQDSMKTFLVTQQGAREVDHDAAAQLLDADGRFAVEGSRIVCDGARIATFRLVQSLGWGRQPSASIHFGGLRALSTLEISALRKLAHAIVTREMGMWTVIDAITVDGRDISHARAEALRRNANRYS